MSATTALDAAPPVSSNEISAKTNADGARPDSPGPAASEPERELAGSSEPESELPDVIAKDERTARARRLRESRSLPPVLRERLAALVEGRGEISADGAAQLPLDECLTAIEQSLPEFLRADRADAARLPHPAGDQFFKGSEEISDEQAEELARRQLANSGLLRGQRVRVAD